MRNRRQLTTRVSEDMRAPGGITFWAIICVAFYCGVWMMIES